ncbi:caspase domain-containing protein [Mycena belliarum]|uniref:Caspase domain-containing protein n=1 Tax=Mycena belliarum TaxID=1033014 RepID=A0AAD6U2I9_9AGAR|nr:caspase domain-containing protein [Mycena belliae]
MPEAGSHAYEPIPRGIPNSQQYGVEYQASQPKVTHHVQPRPVAQHHAQPGAHHFPPQQASHYRAPPQQVAHHHAQPVAHHPPPQQASHHHAPPQQIAYQHAQPVAHHPPPRQAPPQQAAHHHAPHRPVAHHAPPRHHHATPQQAAHHQAPPPPAKHHDSLQPAAPRHKLLPALVSHFIYSKCTGRRRALCIGINYRGQSHELRGCVNDAKHVFSFLVRNKGYKPENIVVLTDDSPHARAQPTRQNMIDAMSWLVRDAQPHDALFFHYSGHGGQTPNRDGTEVDGYDEVIYPVDYKRAGHIVDDEMHSIMVKSLPNGCRLTAVFDSCHSGTVLDLPYMYDSHGRRKSHRHVSHRARARKATGADVISLSGCKDDGTSADTFANGAAVGAASHAFIKAVEMQPLQSYREFLHNVRMILHPKFSQKPQLGSSHPIDTALTFIL